MVGRGVGCGMGRDNGHGAGCGGRRGVVPGAACRMARGVGQGATRGARWLVATAAIGALVLGMVSCTSPTGAALGSFTLTMTVPSGVAASVEVTGPGGYAQTVSATQTLTDLTPGSYQVVAPPARRTGTLVDELFDATVTGAAATVSAGATADVTVSYQQRPGTGALWVAVYGGTKLAAYGAAQLPSGGDAVTPSAAIGLGAGVMPYALAFDAQGNAWAGTQAGLLVEIAAADLAASGTPTPAVTLDTGSTDVNGMAFGSDGTLWAAIADGILGYAPGQLTSSGSPAPAVTISGTTSYPLTYPHALAFDASGGLWVAANTFVARYSPAQLATGGTLDPDVVLESNGTSLNTARGLAFDASGSLWVACWGGSAAEKFRPQDIAASGTPDPFVRLTGIGVNLLRLAFDNQGNLWVTSNFGPGYSGTGHIGMVAAADLVSSGSPPLAASFTNAGSFDSGGTLAFAPRAQGLVGAP